MNSSNPPEEIARFVAGDATTADIEKLAKALDSNPSLTSLLRDELMFSEELRAVFREINENIEATFWSNLESYAQPSDEIRRRVANGCATRFEADRLALEYQSFPENADDLVADLEFDDWLRQAVSESRSTDSFLKSLETRMWAEAGEDQFLDNFTDRLEREIVSHQTESADNVIDFADASLRSSAKTVAILGSAAAAIALGAFIAATVAVDFVTSRSSGQLVASISKTTSNATWGNGARPDAAGKLTAGEYELTEGLITVTLDRGDELIIEGPAKFELSADATAEIEEGLALIRPVSDSGVELASKGLQLNQTTELIGVDARVGSSTRTIVFEGDVGVCLEGGANCRQIEQFEAIAADHERERLVDIPYNPYAFAKAFELLAGVEKNIGDIRIELPGSVISPSGDEEGQIQLFIENESFQPGGQLEVDQIAPGQFAAAENNPGQLLQAGGDLRSYLLQLWPSMQVNADGEVEASLTFDHPVVGVIYSSDRLATTDGAVGSQFNESALESITERGLDSGDDEILLSADRRTLNLRLRGGATELDQIRVLVALN